jgi:hypothetical protein
MTFRRSRISGVFRFLPAEERFEVLDAAQYENHKGPDGADHEHYLQKSRHHRYHQGHNFTMVSDTEK